MADLLLQLWRTAPYTKRNPNTQWSSEETPGSPMGNSPFPQSYENVFRTLLPSRYFEKRKGKKFHFDFFLCGIFTSPKAPKELCNVSSQTRTSPHHPPTGSDR